MKISTRVIPVSLLCIALLSACATRDQPRQTDMRSAATDAPIVDERMGNISDIQVIAISSRTSGGGAILGAIVGGALGNQVGKGDGRRAATVAALVGGAVAGNAIEKRSRKEDEVYRVSIRFDNGNLAQYDYQDIDDLQVGERVKVMDGQIHRL